MSVETSNAPREVWVTTAAGGEPVQVWASDEAARHPLLSMRVEHYVRRDLVVPTVDEIAEQIARPMWDEQAIAAEIIDAARNVHALLLSRIEGDNDER